MDGCMITTAIDFIIDYKLNATTKYYRLGHLVQARCIIISLLCTRGFVELYYSLVLAAFLIQSGLIKNGPITIEYSRAHRGAFRTGFTYNYYIFIRVDFGWSVMTCDDLPRVSTMTPIYHALTYVIIHSFYHYLLLQIYYMLCPQLNVKNIKVYVALCILYSIIYVHRLKCMTQRNIFLSFSAKNYTLRTIYYNTYYILCYWV